MIQLKTINCTQNERKTKKMKLISTIAAAGALVAISSTGAMANQSNSINRSGVRTEWDGGHSHTTVNTQVNRIENGHYDASTRSIKMDVGVPKSGDLKFKVQGDGASVWSHKGDSRFLFSESSSSTGFNYREHLSQDIETNAYSHFENDYAGYEIEAATSAY